MRVVVQKVSEAWVEVAGQILGRIGQGLVVLVGIEKKDGEKEISYMAEKILNLRIFPDSQERLNLSVKEVAGEILSISQFTLTSHIAKGRRPDFSNAEEPLKAMELYESFNQLLAREIHVEKGQFGAMMNVHLVNAGPVTFIIEK